MASVNKFSRARQFPIRPDYYGDAAAKIVRQHRAENIAEAQRKKI